jgi:DNA-binding beta-propeller fold protein YncE
VTTRPRTRLLTGTLAAALAAIAAAVILPGLLRTSNTSQALPLRQAGELALPGASTRFDYESLDPGRGLLFIAHLGDSQVIETDIRARRVIRVITGLPDVHGVLVVPALHRVYATATGDNQMAAIDEDTGRILHRTPTGDYPDGLAYDPIRPAIWTTNETGGTETVIDAATGTVRGTVVLGGETGNVAYDPDGNHGIGQMLADIQALGQVAVINPATLAITRRVPLPGCAHDHGLTLDPPDRLAFIACDGNARLLTLHLTTWQVTSTSQVGDQPDVLAYDPAAGRLYVAAESGDLTILDNHRGHLTVTGRAHLADGSHVVAVDPATHDSYYPIPDGPDGRPVLLIYQPVPESPSAAYRPGRQDRAELSGRSAARIPRRSAEGVR